MQGNALAQSDIISVMNTNNIRACKLVRKCTDRETCDSFHGYFEVQKHEKKQEIINVSQNSLKLRLNMLASPFASSVLEFITICLLTLERLNLSAAFNKLLKTYVSRTVLNIHVMYFYRRCK